MYLDTKECYISRDVFFIENTFPFSDSSSLSVTDSASTAQIYTDTQITIPSVTIQSDSFTPIPSSIQNTNHVTSNPSDQLPLDNISSDPNLTTTLDITSRPIRNRSMPSKFKDYTGLPSTMHTSNGEASSSTTMCTHPLHKYVSYYVVTPSHKAFLANITKIPVPYTYKQALVHKPWADVMLSEINALEANQTWDIVPRPPNKNIVDCKWLFKVKYTAEDQVDKYKARLVAKGFTQTVNYFITYAPVAKMTTVRVILALAAQYNWFIHQMDVNNAFWHGVLNDEIYI